MYIEKTNGPQDVKKLSIDELNALASEMRDALLHRAFRYCRGNNCPSLCI